MQLELRKDDLENVTVVYPEPVRQKVWREAVCAFLSTGEVTRENNSYSRAAIAIADIVLEAYDKRFPPLK